MKLRKKEKTVRINFTSKRNSSIEDRLFEKLKIKYKLFGNNLNMKSNGSMVRLLVLIEPLVANDLMFFQKKVYPIYYLLKTD